MSEHVFPGKPFYGVFKMNIFVLRTYKRSGLGILKVKGCSCT